MSLKGPWESIFSQVLSDLNKIFIMSVEPYSAEYVSVTGPWTYLQKYTYLLTSVRRTRVFF